MLSFVRVETATEHTPPCRQGAYKKTAHSLLGERDELSWDVSFNLCKVWPRSIELADSSWCQSHQELAIICPLSAGDSCPLLCLGAGTPHKPAVITQKGHVLHEASAYTAYLVGQVWDGGRA